jgi:hypothetical protein
MIKHKKKNLKAVYLKFFGSILTVVIIFVLAGTEAFNYFEAIVGENTVLSLLLGCLIFLPGAMGLSYGILLSEERLDMTKLRLGALTTAVILASLVVYSWVYLFMHGLYS